MTDQKREHVGVIVIHGVGDTEPGWAWKSLVPPLQRNNATLAFADHSEVRQLDDIGRMREGRTFEFRVQRGEMADGPKVSFMELFWADLSRVGMSMPARFLAMLQLFFEGPHVLGNSFMRNPLGRLHKLLRALIVSAAWLIRWPIAGVNVSVYTCCLLLLTYEQMQTTSVARYEPYVIAGMLFVLSICAFLFASWRWRQDIILTEIGLASAIFSLVMGGAVLAQFLITGGDSYSNVPSYLVNIAYVIFGLWTIWTVVVVAAAALLILLTIIRLPLWHRREIRPAVVRSAAALGLILSQGVIWKVIVSLFSIVLVGAVVRGSVDVSATCAGAANEFCRQLRDINVRLFGVAAFNLLFLLGLAFIFAGLSIVRLLMRKYTHRLLAKGFVRLPRMIVSPYILAALIIGTVYNAYIYYVVGYGNSWLFGQIKHYAIDNNALLYITGGSTGLFVFLNSLRALQQAAGGVLHIGRDLVDHQYEPGRTQARLLMKKGAQKLSRHPRRVRIQGRLDSLVKNFVQAEHYDRLVFVTHSQGTVIMYDYLRSSRDNKQLADISRIDIVTVGSPLSHLYQYYFHEYERGTSAAQQLHPKLSSWTNLYRIDDPIGNRVDIINENFITNRTLGAGGHVEYWKEPEVCRIIVDLIRGEVAGPPQPREAATVA